MVDAVIFRTLVTDVAAAVEFYSKQLGFEVQTSNAPMLAAVKKGVLRLVLTGPTGTGYRPVDDGAQQGPGGWSRVQLPVRNLEAEVARLKQAGVKLRSDIQRGIATLQVLVSDPAGNVIELTQFLQTFKRMEGSQDCATQAIIRYHVDDMDKAVAFYSEQLGFKVELQNAPILAEVTRGPLRLVLSGAGSTGARPTPDGARPGPGSWNRIQIAVDDLSAEMARLKAAGARFRTGILDGNAALQCLMNDPAGNTIEVVQFKRK